MNNKGQITVFLCLMISVLLIIGITAIDVIQLYSDKSRSVMAVRSSVSDIKALYDSYIFENYHILLFDKTLNGEGEAAIEEKINDSLTEKLGDIASISSVALTDFDMLMDDECQAFREQITDYMGYALVEYGVDSILEETGGEDGSLTPELENEILTADETSDEEDAAQETEPGETAAVPDEPDISIRKEKDPRDVTSDFTDAGILTLVIPEDMEVCSETIDLSEVPSRKNGIFEMWINDINYDFDDKSTLVSNLKKEGSWGSSIVNAGSEAAYGVTVFNYATDTGINEETVFNFETEYIICGKDSDKENLQGVVNRITAIRFPINYAYLCKDSSKMTILSSIASGLTVYAPYLQPVVKHLLAGCWSYVESLADVRCLLAGNRVPFMKSKDSWQTDIDDLLGAFNDTPQDSDKGLCYRDYLIILLALDMKDEYYRMLDVMQLNARQENPSFKMENGAVGFGVDCEISVGDYEFQIHEYGGY